MKLSMGNNPKNRMRWNEHPVVFFTAAVLVLVVISILSLGMGSVRIPVKELFRVVLESDEGSTAYKILVYTRIPRLLGAILAGSALAVAGALIQQVLGNSLASPQILGVNSGAGFFVTLAVSLAPLSVKMIPFAAFIGAFLAVLTVVGISERVSASKTTIVLAGVAISGIFSAGTDVLITLFPHALAGYTDFRMGGLSGMSLNKLSMPSVIILLGILLVILLASRLDILALGADTARSLGMNVGFARTMFLMIAALLAGATVSFAGVLGFVGLIVPHIVRQFLGEQSRSLLVGSALLGAVILTACDLVARTIFSPYEIPVGVVMSLIGGPFFLYLIFHRKKKGGLG